MKHGCVQLLQFLNPQLDTNSRRSARISQRAPARPSASSNPLTSKRCPASGPLSCVDDGCTPAESTVNDHEITRRTAPSEQRPLQPHRHKSDFLNVQMINLSPSLWHTQEDISTDRGCPRCSWGSPGHNPARQPHRCLCPDPEPVDINKNWFPYCLGKHKKDGTVPSRGRSQGFPGSLREQPRPVNMAFPTSALLKHSASLHPKQLRKHAACVYIYSTIRGARSIHCCEADYTRAAHIVPTSVD